jgi:hypothetical protein
MEARTISKQNINRITTCETKIMCRTVGNTKQDNKRNEDILDKLKTKPMVDYIENNQRKWKEHMYRMSTGRIPKQILHYQPTGQR